MAALLSMQIRLIIRPSIDNGNRRFRGASDDKKGGKCCLHANYIPLKSSSALLSINQWTLNNHQHDLSLSLQLNLPDTLRSKKAIFIRRSTRCRLQRKADQRMRRRKRACLYLRSQLEVCLFLSRSREQLYLTLLCCLLLSILIPLCPQRSVVTNGLGAKWKRNLRSEYKSFEAESGIADLIVSV